MNGEKRPITVTAFEVFNIASVVLEMVLTDMANPLEELFASGLWVALTLWITRGRSRAARVLYTCLMAFSAAILIGAYGLGYVPKDARLSSALRFAIEAAALVTLLWWPSTSDWLKTRQRQSAA